MLIWVWNRALFIVNIRHIPMIHLYRQSERLPLSLSLCVCVRACVAISIENKFYFEWNMFNKVIILSLHIVYLVMCKIKAIA